MYTDSIITNEKNKKSHQITRQCAICGEGILVKISIGDKYKGGHYFGKIPLCTKEEQEKSRKAGTHRTKIAGETFDVLNRDPKPYDFAEYWECEKCYNGK